MKYLFLLILPGSLAMNSYWVASIICPDHDSRFLVSVLLVLISAALFLRGSLSILSSIMAKPHRPQPSLDFSKLKYNKHEPS